MTDPRLASLARWRAGLESGAAFDLSAAEFTRGMLSVIKLAEDAIQTTVEQERAMAALHASMTRWCEAKGIPVDRPQ